MARGALVTAILLAGCQAGAPSPVARGALAVSPSDSLFYEVYGHGPDTAVVLHGGPGLDHRYLVPPLAGLLPGRTLIYYDQRGRGRSTAVDTLAISPDSDVADLDAIRRRFGLARLTLVGHHWGAAVAALYAVRYPDHVARMLLVSPFVVHPSFAYEFALLGPRGTDRVSAAAAYRAIAAPSDAEAFCRRFAWWYFLPTPADSPAVAPRIRDEVCAVPDDGLRRGEAVKRALLRSLGSWSWRTALNGVRTPTLVIDGQGPPVVEAAARRWAEHLPNARLLLLSGPSPYPWADDPRPLVRAADDFLRGRWPAGSVEPPPFMATAQASPR